MCFDALEVLVDGVSGWELAGHDGDATGGADGAVYGEVREIYSFFCHLVHVWGLAEGAAVLAHVCVAPVVCEDEDDVGLLSGSGGEGEE